MTYGQGGVMEKHHDHAHCWHVKSISWSAILAGALVGIGLTFLLNLFSVAIGLSIFSINNTGITSLAVGGMIGLAICAIVSMFVAGMVAGYLARPFCDTRHLGVLYGFTTWCLALLLTAILATYVGRYVSSYSNFISNPSTIIITEVSPSPEPQSNPAIIMNAQKATNTFGIGAFIVFVLFFIGAISSCFGGHCGMMCKSEEINKPC